MPQTRQHIHGERPRRQYHSAEGVVVTEEDLQRFCSAYEELNRSEGTIQFYQRKLRRFYQDLPEDKMIRHDTLKKWQEILIWTI